MIVETEPVSYRVAQPDDALCIAVLAMQVFLDTYVVDGLRPDLAREALSVYSPDAFAAQIRDASNHFVLAERREHLVAFSHCRHPSDPSLPTLVGGTELVRLYVQRRAHRQGLGVGLLRRAEEYARQFQPALLWLNAWAGNANARVFYAANGYDDIGESSYVFEGLAYENRVFRKRLDAVR